MNDNTQTRVAMTDLGRLLSGSDAESNLNQLLRVLETEVQSVHRKQSQGLNQHEFAQARQRVNALNSAQLILKSLQIHLSH